MFDISNELDMQKGMQDIENLNLINQEVDLNLQYIRELNVSKYANIHNKTNCINSNNIILQLENLSISYKKCDYSVNDVSLDIIRGEFFAIVGESGSGKSSIVKAILGLTPKASGNIYYFTKNTLNINKSIVYTLTNMKKKLWHFVYKDIQMIFQNVSASLDDALTIYQILKEPLDIYYKDLSNELKRQKIINTLNMLDLSEQFLNRYPRSLSGGQLQRICIARALLLEPKILICDEAISALDVTVKLQIVVLLKKLQYRLNLTIIFISHDLNIISKVCDRMLVMHRSQAVELTNSFYIAKNCFFHPYTKQLFNAII